ncbi:DUF6020 family protein [Paraliobacillus sediminis]|uniref:DUF6020 family protein n=1 Tax=Paraliobacillus sediminis TaxID=1885916 RepID=UPI000E3C6291|nr:DUF6020 family protein [Paraliobacillus sediminis]
MSSKTAFLLLFISICSTVSIVSLKQSFTHTNWYISLFIGLLFVAFYYYLARLIHKKRHMFFNLVSQPVIFLIIVLFSLAVTFSFKGSLEHLTDNSWFTQLFVYLGGFFTIVVIIYTVTYLILNATITMKPTSISKRQLFYYAIPCTIVWILCLLAFFPGAMTPDSLSHWRQIHTLEFSNWHPVLYTWFMLVLTSIWHSPAIVVIGQSIILALIFGYGMYSLNRYGLHKRITWTITIIFALSPVNSGFVLMLWKDVLYSACLFLLTIVLFRIVLSEGAWLKRWPNLLLLASAMLGVLFIRNNGFPIIILLGVCLLSSYRFYFKRVLFLLASVFAFFYLVTGPLYDYLEVIPANANEAMGIPTQQIAHVITSDGELSQEQEAYFNRILPIEQWKSLYNPYRTDPLKFAADFNSEVITSDNGTFLKNWVAVVYQNPILAIEAFAKQTSLVWQINQPDNGYTDIFTTTIYQPNEYGLETQSISPWLQTNISRWYSFSQAHMKEIIWRPAVYTFAIILLSFVSSIKLGWRVWLIALPVLLNTATIYAGLPAQDFRYLYSNTLVVYMLLMLAFLVDDRSVVDE